MGEDEVSELPAESSGYCSFHGSYIGAWCQTCNTVSKTLGGPGIISSASRFCYKHGLYDCKECVPENIHLPKPDMVNHPPHYKAHPSGVECIQITEHMNFNLGNAVKYIWRSGEKGSTVQDLEKARWYLDREIQRLRK